MTARFSQTDIVRALKGAEAAGRQVSKLEITPEGQIILHFGDYAAVTEKKDWRATSKLYNPELRTRPRRGASIADALEHLTEAQRRPKKE